MTYFVEWITQFDVSDDYGNAVPAFGTGSMQFDTLSGATAYVDGHPDLQDPEIWSVDQDDNYTQMYG